jgi:ATP-dependent Clp protease ATP-binding subunit ClpB
VLFDEIEKAHPEVFNVLLQILDDGRLTDGQGRTVDFRNTVLIMTSNIGSSHILEQTEAGAPWSEIDAYVRGIIHDNFKPEFLNRIDSIEVFKPLSREDLSRIVDLQLERLKKMLQEREITLEVTGAAKERITDVGYQPAFGGRPLKRAIQRLVADPLAIALLEGKFSDGDVIRVDADRGSEQLTFERIERTLERSVTQPT